uniref:Uncharacterized protein n=1 Tax=Arundo donax TaxID=35708 RepID=A0A0A9UKJ6_ARUDO
MLPIGHGFEPTPLLKSMSHSLSRLHLKAHTTLVSYCLIRKTTTSTMHVHMPTLTNAHAYTGTCMGSLPVTFQPFSN